MKKKFLPLLFIGFYACSDTPSSSTPQKEVLPNTSETVSKQWQYLLDNNEFDKAAALSSESTKEWLAENRAIFLDDNQTYQTQFLEMNCAEEGERAICHCIMRDETGESFADIFSLIKVDGQWLVELADENSTPDLEEQLFREIEKELQLSGEEIEDKE